MAWKTRIELGIGEKKAKRLREQKLVEFLPRGVKGREYYYDEASFEKYLESNAQKAKPPELPFEILKKEVKKDWKSLKALKALEDSKDSKRRSKMSKKWEKVIANGKAKDGLPKGTPTGQLRHQGHGFSIVKDSNKKLGFQYSLDILKPKRTTLALRKIAGRPVFDDSDAFNVAYEFVTKRFTDLASANSPDPTFSQLIPDYEEDLIGRDRDKAEDMVKRVKAVLEPYFGPLKASKIQLYPHIVAYRDKRRKDGVKDSTIGNEVALARALFNVARVKRRVNCGNPFEKVGIHLGLKTNRDIKVMSYEEQKRIWPLLKKYPPMDKLSVVALNTGMRPHNLIALRKSQIRWDEERIHIAGEEAKKDREMIFPINDTVKEILERLCEENCKEPDDFVFLCKNGRGEMIPISRQWYQANWRKIRAEADVDKKLKFYSLKHTYATHLAEQEGCDAFTIRDALNHVNLQSTEQYVGRVKKKVVKANRQAEASLNRVSL